MRIPAVAAITATTLLGTSIGILSSGQSGSAPAARNVPPANTVSQASPIAKPASSPYELRPEVPSLSDTEWTNAITEIEQSTFLRDRHKASERRQEVSDSFDQWTRLCLLWNQDATDGASTWKFVEGAKQLMSLAKRWKETDAQYQSDLSSFDRVFDELTAPSERVERLRMLRRLAKDCETSSAVFTEVTTSLEHATIIEIGTLGSQLTAQRIKQVNDEKDQAVRKIAKINRDLLAFGCRAVVIKWMATQKHGSSGRNFWSPKSPSPGSFKTRPSEWEITKVDATDYGFSYVYLTIQWPDDPQGSQWKICMDTSNPDDPRIDDVRRE